VARRDRRPHQLLARIGQCRSARVRHERDVPAAVQLPDEHRDLPLVIELGIRGQVLGSDLVLAQQDLRMPRVLAGDHVRFLEYAECTLRHVFEIADRRRDEIQLPHY